MGKSLFSEPRLGKERKIVDHGRFVYNGKAMKPRDENFRSVFIYSDEMAQFEYSPTHPFKPMRARLTVDLCRRYGLLEHPWIRIVKPEPLGYETLADFHDPAYLKIM